MIQNSDRLKIYKEALFNYRLSRLFPFLSYFLGTSEGFCKYFCENNFGLPLDQLPELKEQAPSKKWNGFDGYWFKPGNKRHRIKCLKKAIKLYKSRH